MTRIKQFERDIVPDSQCTIHSAYEEGSVPSNIYEYFTAIENGQFPFFNNTSTHISAMRNAMGETLLICAARLGHASIVERLVNDIDVEETDNDGWNALLNAAHEGHVTVVRVLLDSGASIEQPDLMGWTPLLWACYKNHSQVVEELLARKAHINVVGEEDGLTPLLIASGRGFVDIVRKLLAAGAQVNASDKFGNTALTWAARKGLQTIVEDLLAAGAEVDSIGMQSSTALMLASRGNYGKLVDTLLSREPNVNIVDYNGLSALGIASREGYTDIAQSLIQSGAFVNTVDRFGNSILASSVRSGNIHLVRLLLEKHADVNAKDSEARTPLHLAIDKSYADIVVALLEKRPNLEIKNKDGDTALIRAVKNRDMGIVQLLVNMSAKISATDNAGDNSLHLAIRSRSKKLTQILLVNPGDSKLLYRPNKLGETPYSIDQESASPILSSIFGSIGSTEFKSFTGYDIYSDVLADIVCEPNLSLPLAIGLYSKWGSGKSFLLPKIRESMRAFSRTWLDGIELYWSWTVVTVLFFVCTFLTLVMSATFTVVSGSSHIVHSVAIGAIICAIVTSIYGFIYYGSEVKLWNSSIVTARNIARWIARFKIVLSVLTLNAPIRTDKELVVSPVSFLFSDDHRLSFIGGEQSLTKIVHSLFDAAEDHYGTLSVRLFFALRVQTADRSSKLQTLCGIPVIIYILVMLVSLVVALILVITGNALTIPAPGSTRGHLIAALIFMSIFICCLTTLVYVVGIKLLINSPRRRINRIAHNLHSMPFERIVQKLQREVDLLVSVVNSIDAFTNSQTRLVIMVDGLDNCEQNKMVHLLDALSLLFCSRQNLPFVVILAIDPNIVISSIQQNLRLFVGGPVEITGTDYMNNIVTMPFYLDQSSLRSIQKLKQPQYSMGQAPSNSMNLIRDRRRSETFKGSRLSLREPLSSQKDVVGNQLASNNEIGNFFPSYDYFTNLNPRIMRRIVNSIALTGRLLRIFDVSFTWIQLYSWISLIEQWPFRMSWLIDMACSHQDDSLSLSDLYSQIKQKIVVNENMMNNDRNSNDFETVLRKMNASRVGQLTVGLAKSFSLCTSNLDPSLRKMVREQRGTTKPDTEQNEDEEVDQAIILKEVTGDAEFLFDDVSVWFSITKQLAKMTIEEFVILVEQLNIAPERLQKIVRILHDHNLNGLALYSCNMLELKDILKLPLGDWTMFHLLIETLRRFSTEGLPKGQNCCLVGRCKLQTTDLAKNETGQQPIGSNNHSRGTKCPPSNTQLPPQQQNSLQSICEEEQLVAQRQINTEEENPSPPTFSSNGDENYEDCDDGDNDSMVSNAGSEHSLIRSSVSQKRGSS